MKKSMRETVSKEALASAPPANDDETSEESCAAFGYLRGIREKADALEVRFKNGTSIWLPYNWLGSWKFDPSNGLLLKFSGDVVYLILISGSNLNRPLLDSTTNLTTSGLQRRRVVWMREMTDDEIRRVRRDVQVGRRFG